jgi:glycine/D-amino acid oxidase-like deaminating enzyme
MTHAAVLGAGIMGCATALWLARRGDRVTLIDAADRPFAGASRWNEGKIHLGYLYAADASLETARRLLPGGLAFKPLTESLIGCALDDAIAHDDDTFVVHRDSIVGAEAAGRYYAQVTALVTGHADAARYLTPVDAARVRRLSPAELTADYDPAHVVAGFRVPERSVSTTWVADRFVAAVTAEPRVDLRLRTTVVGVRRTGRALDSRLIVETSGGSDGPYDWVVNALWEGRLAVDASVGLPPPPVWSHRFRLSAFLHTSRPVPVPSTVVATGPFGDIKNYDCRNFYASWYPSGLVVEGTDLAPPTVPPMTGEARRALLRSILTNLERIVPSVTQLSECADEARVEGGWVYAAGCGSLSNPASTLHRRDRIGITQAGSYISVDTGKYSIAPWLAREVVRRITQRSTIGSRVVPTWGDA